MADVVAALQPEKGPGSHFGHRDHLRLGWSVLVTYGIDAGEETVCAVIRIAADANGFGDRYHETMTRFWCRQMAPVLGDPDETFDEFYERNSRLHDKRLVARHYSAEVLDSRAARQGWVEPDLAPMGGD